MRASTALVALSFITSVAAARADSLPAPLTGAQKTAFYGSPEDALNKPVCENLEHGAKADCKDKRAYVHTNEWYIDEFRPFIENIGGGYIGVGSDQGLTFAAWQRAEVAWLMDYDIEVVRMNKVIRAFVLESDTVDAYLARWGKDKAVQAQSRAILDKAYAGDPEQARILSVYTTYAGTMRDFYAKVMRLKGKQRLHFLHDADDYAWVRGLYQRDRIRVVGGDLLKDKALRGIGQVAAQLGVPIRVFYISCAEQYWGYSKTYKANIAALPMDERSVILRLLFGARWGKEKLGLFHYIVQSGLDYKQRMERADVTSVDDMMKMRKQHHKGVLTVAMQGTSK
ncbi:MAG TPA: hypothetical protein VL172_19360 [Kofleriaceae bacterium]|nr:hypothetical protein [Kofleriaceae bacterium]